MATGSTDDLESGIANMSVNSYKDDLKTLLKDISVIILSLIKEGTVNSDKVITEIVSTRNIYNKGLSSIGPRPDFKKSETRLAYIFSYFIRHVHLVHTALSKIQTELNEREQPHMIQLTAIRLMCQIGGGPNVDSVGLRLFLKNQGEVTNSPFPKEVHVFDKSVYWKRSWNLLCKKIPENYRHKAKYSEFDFLAEILSDAPLDVIREADLITMVKSVSSVDADTDRVISTFRTILEAMKPGALLLFIDNRYSKWKAVFDGAQYTETHTTIVEDEDLKVEDLETADVTSKKFVELRKKLKDNVPLLKTNESKTVMLLLQRNGADESNQ